MSDSIYKKSGVDIDEGNKFVKKIKEMVESTHTQSVIGGLGGFAGIYDLKSFKNLQEPVLVSSTDGVGTKLRVAIEADVLDTVGIDLVAMSVNDLIVTGARPLFFLDYIATGVLSSADMAMVVNGVVEGCKASEVALLGGETAEMPGMYEPGDFDLAGFAVGIANKPDIIDGSNIKEGDVVLGLASSGFHSNGYSLLRKIFFEDLGMTVHDFVPAVGTVAEILLEPTKIYVKSIMQLLGSGVKINGMVHITGGGFYDNLPRVLPDGLKVIIDKAQFPTVKPIFALQTLTSLPEKELYRVFNMGIGYVVIVSKNDEEEAMRVLKKSGESVSVIGYVEKGNKEVIIKGIDI